MSVIAPIHAPSLLSDLPSDDTYQEILEEFPGTKYGEKYPFEIMIKFPDDTTLTQCKVKLPEKTSGNSNRGNFMVEFPSG